MKARHVLLLILLAPSALADDLSEDFESFSAFGSEIANPDQNWYDYYEGEDIGEVTLDNPIQGSVSMRFNSTEGSQADNVAAFDLANPTQVTSISFFINATQGTQQYITLEGSAPRRALVQFHILCGTSVAPTYCEFRARTQQVDGTGQVVVPASMNQTRFKVEVFPNWSTAQFCLEIDDVSDGCTNMLELPRDFQRIRFNQYRSDQEMLFLFDWFNVTGAINGSAIQESSDFATGLVNFANDIHFTRPTSRFLLGIVVFIVLVAAVVSPMIALGKDNSLTPVIGIFATLVSLWLIQIEFWPDWIGIALIIFVAALVSFVVRRVLLGIQSGISAASLVATTMGYFIIASSLLAFSGYAGQAIELPTDLAEEDIGSPPANTTVTQSFAGAVVDCIVSFFSDCDRETRSKQFTWLTDTVDSIGRVTATIFSYGKAAVEFLFQLLTFQLPVPILFNILIVFPPAAALATIAIQTIRGVGS